METLNETIELKTPSGEHTVVLKPWFTGADIRDNRRYIMTLKDREEMSGPEVIEVAENQLIKLIVLSLDGSDENILERILKMRSNDYEFIIEKVNEASSDGLDKKKEAISDGSTQPTSEESPSA